MDLSELTVAEQLTYSTIRIENIDVSGNVSSGTGFFYRFPYKDEKEEHIPVIITNKHVVKNVKILRFTFTGSDENFNPLNTKHHKFDLHFDSQSNSIRFHPHDDVDLCAIPIAEVLETFENANINVFYSTVHKDLLPTKQQIDDFDVVEELLMIGYPNGIWDSFNNKPIFRKGITATHPNLDYCGKKEIMIDMACFPGSSGSPVFVYNGGSYKTKTKSLMAGSRLILLGILYAGPQHTATGNIEIVNIPTRQEPISISRIPNNLGLIIKAERILELQELFK